MKIKTCITNGNDYQKAMANNTMHIVQELNIFL